MNTLPAGSVLDSGQHRYRIVKVLGQGGFGITYQAVAKIKVGNVTIDGLFAIKEHFISSYCERKGTTVTVSNPSNAQEVNDSLNSFLTEAERLNRLSLEHDGLVKVNESFRTNDTAYYVMEYIGGENLRQYVKRQPAGRLSEAEALPIINKVSEAVSYLHRNQVTHLDIKPDNILLREDGTPVLIDFGLAKHYDKKGNATSTLKVAGCSDGYAPLEQYAGITRFTPQADVYALAATLLYMLTGKDPRKASDITPAIIGESLSSDVSENTRLAIVHAMQKLAESRTKSVVQLQEELQSVELKEELHLDAAGGTETKKHDITKTRSHNVKKAGRFPKFAPWKNVAIAYGVVMSLVLVVFVLNMCGGKPVSEFDGLTAAQIADVAEDYYFGRNGKTKDYAMAVKWARKAAELGNSKGQFRLGCCYDFGKGVTQDYAEAVNWYRKSADQGHAVAQFNLGVCYANGYGVTQDYAEAVKWTRMAAEQGLAQAQYALGYSYYNGDGVTQDYAEAVKWYRLAADQGNAYAQFMLGDCYYNGYGVTQDREKAKELWRKAAAQGHQSAKDNLKTYFGE